MTIKIEELFIEKSAPLIKVLHQMDRLKRKLLIVVDNNIYLSLISIGDIQRSIIKENNLQLEVQKVLRTEVKVANISDDIEKIKTYMRERRNEFMPVLDTSGNIVKVIFWEDLFAEKRLSVNLKLPVVIMAGGKGTRLKPLTNVIPKPLIPIKQKTIIEDIMDRFVSYGCSDFYLSVNYKTEMIKYYFDELNNSEYNITYIKEDKPLGTAGSLSLLKDKLNSTFFVSNCDILVDEDYEKIFEYHSHNHNEITIVAALKDYLIPYGTLETSNEGCLTKISEKPILNFKINTGMYILEPHLLEAIPENTFLHITSLIEEIIERNGKVGVFPISEGSWVDIGTWTEYLKIMGR